MDTATIDVTYAAPVLWRRTPRHRAKWHLAQCSTQAEIPALSAAEASVAITVEADDRLPRFPKPKGPMQWRSGPAGLMRDAAEIRSLPRSRVGSGPVHDSQEFRDIPKRPRDARGAEIIEMAHLDEATAVFVCPSFDGRNQKDPIVTEAELAAGEMLEDRRGAVLDQVRLVLSRCALVDGKAHAAATEPFWRVSSESDYSNAPCVTLCDDPDGSPRRFSGNVRDPAEVAVMHVFRIDRLPEAVEQADLIRAEENRPTGILTDAAVVSPGYVAAGPEIGPTLAYNWRLLTEPRDSRIRGCSESKALYRAAVATARTFETTGEGRDDMIDAIRALNERTRGFWSLIRRLDESPAPLPRI